MSVEGGGWNPSSTTPTLRAHCYGLLRTIMGTTTASDSKITANPCDPRRMAQPAGCTDPPGVT
jgi:hypothetical protein